MYIIIIIINKETLKWLSSLPHLNAGVTGGDIVAIGI